MTDLQVFRIHQIKLRLRFLGHVTPFYLVDSYLSFGDTCSPHLHIFDDEVKMFVRNIYTIYRNTRHFIPKGCNRKPVFTAVITSNLRHIGTLKHIREIFFNCYNCEPSFIGTGPTVTKLLLDGATAWHR
jgi:hypothetical protein